MQMNMPAFSEGLIDKPDEDRSIEGDFQAFLVYCAQGAFRPASLGFFLTQHSLGWTVRPSGKPAAQVPIQASGFRLKAPRESQKRSAFACAQGHPGKHQSCAEAQQPVAKVQPPAVHTQLGHSRIESEPLSDEVEMFEPETQPKQEGRKEDFLDRWGAEVQGVPPQSSGFRRAAAGQAANLSHLTTDLTASSTSANTAAITYMYMRSELQKMAAEKSWLLDKLVNLREELLLHQECELRVAQLIARLSEARDHKSNRSGMLLQIVEDINNTRTQGGPTGLSLLAVNFGKQMRDAWEGNCWQTNSSQLQGPTPSQTVSATFYHNATTISPFSATHQAALFPITAGRFAGKAATLPQLQRLGWAGLQAMIQEYRERFTFLLAEVRRPSAERVAAVKQEAEQLMIEIMNFLTVHYMSARSSPALSWQKDYVPNPSRELIPVIRQAVAAAGLSQAQVETFSVVHRQQQRIIGVLDRGVDDLEIKVQAQLQDLGGCLGEAAEETDAYKTLLDTAMQLKHAILERSLAQMVAGCTFYFRHLSPFQMAILWARSFPFKPRMEHLQLALESA